MPDPTTSPINVTLGPLVYDHIPRLKELLPKQGGLPGFQYAQVSGDRRRRAQDEGWLQVNDSYTYTIIGPKGSIDMDLFCRGKLIPGQPSNSGKRVMVVEHQIWFPTSSPPVPRGAKS